MSGAPSPEDLPKEENPLVSFGDRDSVEIVYVSGWRSAGWVALHLHHSNAPFGWLRLDGCRTVADCVLALGHSMGLPVPGQLADVASAFADLKLKHVGVDARTASAELMGAFHAAISAMSPHTRWWAAVHEPLPIANHIATVEPMPALDSEGLPSPVEAGVWFSGSPRVRLNLSQELQRPDAPNGLLRVDFIQHLRAHPRRSIGAVVDGLIGTHSELFDLATESAMIQPSPAELFGLRLIAEYATDDNIACLAGAAAIRARLSAGQPTEALERTEQVLARTARADPAHRALAVWAEATVQLHTGDLHRAQARFADAEALTEAGRDRALLATMNRRWGDALHARRLFSQASHRYRRALGLYRQRGDAEGAAAATRGAADIAVAAGELLSAEALFDQADVNTTTGPEQVNRLLGQVSLAIARRKWDHTQRLMNRIQRIGVDSTVGQANLNRRIADRALRSGDAVTAAQQAGIARGQYARNGETAAAAACDRLQADAAASQGELMRALDLYRSAIDAQARAGDWLGLARSVEHLGHLDLSRGRAESAAKLMDISRELVMIGGGS